MVVRTKDGRVGFERFSDVMARAHKERGGKPPSPEELEAAKRVMRGLPPVAECSQHD